MDSNFSKQNIYLFQQKSMNNTNNNKMSRRIGRIILAVPLHSQENEKVMTCQKTVYEQRLGNRVQQKTKLVSGSVRFWGHEAIRGAGIAGELERELLLLVHS